jgi:hypothetical protein
MATAVTDPDLIAQLEGRAPAAPASSDDKTTVPGPKRVTDPALLEQLEGRAPAAEVAAAPSAPITAGGLYRAADVGLQKGVAGIASLPRTIGELGARGIQGASNLVSRGLGLPEDTRDLSKQQGAINLPTYQSALAEIQKPGGMWGGKPYTPQNTAEEYMQTLGEFAPNVAFGGAGAITRGVLAPALASETAGQLTKGTSAEPWARVGSALLAPSGVAAARRVVSPFPATSGRQAMVDVLKGEGVPTTAGQQTGRESLKYAEGFLGNAPLAGGKATAIADKQAEAFTRATLKRIGMDDVPTPQNVNKAVQDIQNEFSRLSAATTVRFDNKFANDITTTLNRYYKKLPSQQKEVVDNYVNDLAGLGGSMPGDAYQIARSDLGRHATAVKNSDPTLSGALRGLRDALDDAAGRAIPVKDQKAWKTARKQWEAWKTIEGAAKETDAAGNVKITPAALKQAAAAKNRGQFARGQGQFNELSRAGSEILRALPNSGTAQRNLLTGLVGGGGIGAAYGTEDPRWLLAMGAPALAGRTLMSPAMQRYLANQVAVPAARLPKIAPGLLAATTEANRGLLEPETTAEGYPYYQAR